MLDHPFLIAVLFTFAAIGVFACIGYYWAACYVAARNNAGHVFGGIFGLLVTLTVHAFAVSTSDGTSMAVFTCLYFVAAVRIQSGS